MFFIIMIIGLIFLIAGGVGLFVTNVNGIVGTLNWMQGNIVFATFTIVGIVILVFLLIFGSEVE